MTLHCVMLHDVVLDGTLCVCVCACARGHAPELDTFVSKFRAYCRRAWSLQDMYVRKVHKQGHMTTGHSVETQEILTKEPVPCRHMPLLM